MWRRCVRRRRSGPVRLASPRRAHGRRGAPGAHRLVFRAQLGDAAAEGSPPPIPPRRTHRRGEISADALGDGVRTLRGGMGEKRDELVAAVAREDIRVAQVPARDVHHRAQRLVAALVPQRVVERLEVVDVEEDDGERVPVAPRGGELVRRQVEEVAAVARAGQRIRARERPLPRERRLEVGVRPLQRGVDAHQLLLLPLPLGDVLVDDDRAGDGIVHHQGERRVEHDLARSVEAFDLDLLVRRRLAPADRPRSAPFVRCDRLAGAQPPPAILAERLRTDVARPCPDPLPGRVPEDDLPGRVEDPHPHG